MLSLCHIYNISQSSVGSTHEKVIKRGCLETPFVVNDDQVTVSHDSEIMIILNRRLHFLSPFHSQFRTHLCHIIPVDCSLMVGPQTNRATPSLTGSINKTWTNKLTNNRKTHILTFYQVHDQAWIACVRSLCNSLSVNSVRLRKVDNRVSSTPITILHMTTT